MTDAAPGAGTPGRPCRRGDAVGARGRPGCTPVPSARWRPTCPAAASTAYACGTTSPRCTSPWRWAGPCSRWPRPSVRPSRRLVTAPVEVVVEDVTAAGEVPPVADARPTGPRSPPRPRASASRRRRSRRTARCPSATADLVTHCCTGSGAASDARRSSRTIPTGAGPGSSPGRARPDRRGLPRPRPTRGRPRGARPAPAADPGAAPQQPGSTPRHATCPGPAAPRLARPPPLPRPVTPTRGDRTSPSTHTPTRSTS